MNQRVLGTFRVQHLRNGNVLLDKTFKNLSTIEGRNYMLGVAFKDFVKYDTWYIGLISNGSFTAVSEDDVHGSHAGWVEFTDYDEASRVEWENEATPLSGSLAFDEDFIAEFTINAAGVLKGAFVTSDPTKGDGSGAEILWSAAAFANEVGTVTVADDDVIKIGYTVSLVL